jgi:protein-S-isoprenylcysteine O-methyltransferase Ste14
VSEETREPRSNAYEDAQMSATARKRQAGNTLFTVGVLLFVFALVLVMFVPSDIRSGHHFWTAVFGIDLILAGILTGIGYRIRKRMGPA